MGKSMAEHARSWKTPEERAEMKKAGNAKAMKVAKKEAKMAPPDTTKMRGKNSAASKGPGPEGFTKMGATKRPASMKDCGK